MHSLAQAMQGMPGLLGGDAMGFGGMPLMQQGGYPQAPPQLSRGSMELSGNASPTHSGLAGLFPLCPVGTASLASLI